jgi:predicted dehydrogenase
MKLGIIGAGAMGTNHARVASKANSYILSGVYDQSLEASLKIAQNFECLAAKSLEELIEKSDALIIATPTFTHAEYMSKCFSYGRHFLVEKPVTELISDIDVGMLQSSEIVMAVGHIERFNPAIRYTKSLNLGRVITFSARREGPYSGRISEGVTRDLMIHDLDLATYVLNESIHLQGASHVRSRSETEDSCSAVLKSENGTVVSLFASRVGQTKVRDIRIVTDEFQLSLDLLQRTVTRYKQGESEYVGNDALTYSERLTVETPMLSNFPEPLAAEQQAFVTSILNGVLDSQLATLEQGLNALEISNSITG